MKRTFAILLAALLAVPAVYSFELPSEEVVARGGKGGGGNGGGHGGGNGNGNGGNGTRR